MAKNTFIASPCGRNIRAGARARDGVFDCSMSKALRADCTYRPCLTAYWIGIAPQKYSDVLGCCFGCVDWRVLAVPERYVVKRSVRGGSRAARRIPAHRADVVIESRAIELSA